MKNLLIFITGLMLCLSCTRKSTDSSEETPQENQPNANSTETVQAPEQLSSLQINDGTLTVQAGVVSTIDFNHVGDAVDSYSISPSLPATLSLNTATGAITGSMPYLVANQNYTLTATNSGGSTELEFTLAVVSRFSGSFTLVDEIANGELDTAGVQNVNDLDNTLDVIMSPDSSSLYFTSDTADSISALETIQDGGLQFSQTYDDGIDSTELEGAAGVVMSFDGRFVYVAGRNDFGIAVFSRNAGDGSLTHIQDVRDTENGVTGLDTPSGFEISPDGKSLLAGSDSTTMVHFDINTDGTLSYNETFTNNTDDGHGNTIRGISDVQGIAFTPNGQWVYFSAVGTNSIALMSRNTSDGDLQFVKSYENANASYQDEAGVTITGMTQPKRIRTSPDGMHLYVACDSGDGIFVFSINQQDGGLTLVQKATEGATDAGGATIVNIASNRGAEVSPDGAFVAAYSDTNHNVQIFSRNFATGELTHLHTYTDNGTDSQGATLSRLNSMRHGKFSPNGENFYAFTTFSEDAVTIFKLDTTP